MTDYSKLSDAEIAERVCRKLGWKHSAHSTQLHWLADLFPVLMRDDGSGWMKPMGKSPFEWACFDWPAPIIMQKVEEWLIKRDIEPSLTYCNIDHIWYSYLDCTQYDSQLDEISVESNRKPRALYEAFLQVEGKND